MVCCLVALVARKSVAEKAEWLEPTQPQLEQRIWIVGKSEIETRKTKLPI